MQQVKKLFIKSQESEMKNFLDLFNYLLENKNYNLDCLVKGNSLAVEDSISEEFLGKLRSFLDLLPEIIRKTDNKEEIWSSFENLDDYDSNKKFINWMKKFVETRIRPVEDARFINELDLKTFEAITHYCLENLILKDVGLSNIDEKWNRKQIIIIRKMLFTLIDMLEVDFCSDEYALENMERTFGIKREYSKRWLYLIKDHEDKLWKIMLMKRFNRIENKLDELLDKMDDNISAGIL